MKNDRDRSTAIGFWLCIRIVAFKTQIGMGCLTPRARCKMWTTGQELQNGKYRLEAILGVGRFGVTYRSVEQPSGRIVAIKTLNIFVQHKPNFAQAQEKFIKEAFRLSQCSHPHIVKVYDIFQEGGLWGMAMEYIGGINLKEYLERKGKLSQLEGLRYIRQIGAALICVHDRGFLHRDVKPQNIMLQSRSSHSEDYEAILIDFGLARGFTTGKTETHTNIGTECFAPIEQYKTRSKRGEFTDVYALAATLYNLLTGKRPCPADIREQGTQLVPPIQHNSNLSQDVNDAILQGMALESEHRSATVKQWLSLLQTNRLKLETSGDRREDLSPPRIGQEADREKNDRLRISIAEMTTYATLERVLSTQVWKEADRVTNSLILKISGVQKKRVWPAESIANFPCEDLQKIDRLWRHYSRHLRKLKPLSSKLLGDTRSFGQPDEWQRIFRGFGRFFETSQV
ncbi:MAG: protein kinase, partial [Geitlerinemataceae cyanobacterium]